MNKLHLYNQKFKERTDFVRFLKENNAYTLFLGNIKKYPLDCVPICDLDLINAAFDWNKCQTLGFKGWAELSFKWCQTVSDI